MKFKDSQNGSLIIPLIWGVTASILGLFLFSIIAAFILTSANIVGDSLKTVAVIILGLSSFSGGFLTSKKCDKNKLLFGLFSGIIFYFFVAVIAVAITKNALTGTFVIRLLVCCISSTLAALVDVLTHNDNKYI